MLSTNRFCSRLHYKTFSSWTLCQYTQVHCDTKDNFSEYFIHYLQILPFRSQKESYIFSLSLSLSFSISFSGLLYPFLAIHLAKLPLISYIPSTKSVVGLLHSSIKEVVEHMFLDISETVETFLYPICQG